MLSAAAVATPRPPPTETVAIIVQNPLYPSISSAVTQYRTDLNNSGFNTILYTQTLNTHQELKNNLTSWYNTYTNFVGAVLIGRLPHARYRHPISSTPTYFAAETFICDLYLQDLDGNWWDLNSDTVYDKHNATAPADIYPEIYIGRIDPQCLSWDIPANFINTYLARVHSYRTGGVQRQQRALLYVDDDWAGATSSYWDTALSTAYSTRTLVDFPTTWTNATNWLSRITQNYQWGHLGVHSWPWSHVFGPGGGGAEGITTANPQIRTAPPSFNFYNLFACSANRWNTTDALGPTYTFSGSYSLATVGSTKTGGMLDNIYFYTPIGQNKTIGESLRDWFSSTLMNGAFEHWNQWVEWSYGISITGDPFLSIWYDNIVLPPVISSTTHLPATWSPTTQAQLNWSVPADVNGIVGYYWLLDTNPNTVPTAATGTYTTINGTLTSALSDGIWYLHVVAKDGAGNTGAYAGHFALYIDANGPTVSITTPTSGQLITGSSTILSWTAVDSGSGYQQAQIFLDGSIYASVTNNSLTVKGLLAGSHTLKVTASDVTGNTGSSQVTFTVQLTAAPPIPGFPVEAIALGAVLALGLGFVQRRRRRNK
ncbi:MAG: Ig-like domain-containing protein [Promethearchaeota archaeon]